MRLINTRSLELEEFKHQAPRYAILSHTWGDDEVTFDDWGHQEKAAAKAGYEKIRFAKGQAINDGIEYLWVDSVCIDRANPLELSEAINSMYSWYRDAYVCYAFLADVVDTDHMAVLSQEFADSRWFTRGWTLQELLAPSRLVFFSKFWDRLGTKAEMAKDLFKITGIDEMFLLGKELSRASVSKRMSWMARRQTTKVEDLAYCMLGLFDINMPLLYGEGRKAFTRLQGEIMKEYADETLFCWEWDEETPADWVSMLAPAPSNFANTGGFSESYRQYNKKQPYAMTNLGVNINLNVIATANNFIGILNARAEDSSPVGIPLAGVPETNIFWRKNFPSGLIRLPIKGMESSGVCKGSIFVLSRPPQAAIGLTPPAKPLGPQPFGHAMMISFSDAKSVHVLDTAPTGRFDERTSILSMNTPVGQTGFYGTVVRVQVCKKYELKLLFAVNAADGDSAPTYYFKDLSASKSSQKGSAAAAAASTTAATTKGLHIDLEAQIKSLKPEHEIRGSRYMQKAGYAVSIGNTFALPQGGALRLAHIRVEKHIAAASTQSHTQTHSRSQPLP